TGELGIASLFELGGDTRTLVAIGADLHLDQLVIFERAARGGQHGFRKTTFADVHDRLERMRHAAEVFALGAGQPRRITGIRGSHDRLLATTSNTSRDRP